MRRKGAISQSQDDGKIKPNRSSKQGKREREEGEKREKREKREREESKRKRVERKRVHVDAKMATKGGREVKQKESVRK